MTDLLAQAEALEWAFGQPASKIAERAHQLRAQAAEQPAEAVAPVLIALAWSKARNVWMQSSRHGTQEAADLLAIAELTHYLDRPDPRIAQLEGLLRRSQLAVRVLHTMLDVSLTHSVGIEVAKELDADIEAALGGK